MPQPALHKTTARDDDERRENGTVYMLIGWLCWMFALLVMFFNPAAIKLGTLNLVEIALFLAVAGLALNIIGFRIRRRQM